MMTLSDFVYMRSAKPYMKLNRMTNAMDNFQTMAIKWLVATYAQLSISECTCIYVNGHDCMDADMAIR